MIAMSLVGLSLLVCIVGLLVNAFSNGPDADFDFPDAALGVQCLSPVQSVGQEAWQTFVMFALGYLCSVAIRRRQDLARHADRILCLAKDSTCSACMLNFVRARN